MLSEINQAETNKYCVSSLISGIKQTNKQTHIQLIEKRSDLWLPEVGVGKGEIGEEGSKR